MKKLPKIIKVKMGFNPNSSSVGAELSMLVISGMSIIVTFITSIIVSILILKKVKK